MKYTYQRIPESERGTLLMANPAHLPLPIGARARSVHGEATFDRLNPITGELATRAPAADVQDARAVVETAAAAFPAWAETGPGARRALLLKAADRMEVMTDEFVAAMRDEVGATEGWARFNVMLAAGMIREAAAMTTQIAGEVIPSDKPGCVAMAVRQAAGVVVGIAPWNAPVILGVRAIATPLACGNTVVLKASELCPRTHWLIVRAFQDAGLPPGVVNALTNAPADAASVVEALVAHPAVRRVNFTGSTKVGKIIARLGAEHLKPVLLELGGKAPLVVLEDADLDEAVKAAAFGAFMNQGQICMSTERIVVVDAVADAFVAEFAAKAATLVAGDPSEGRTPLGAVVDRHAVDRVLDLVSDATAKGARLVAGGAADGAADGVLMSATVLDGVTPDMRIYAEESFGPVVGVVRVKDEAEAIAVANDTEYGLSAAVFTRDVARGLRVARRIQSGICHINGPTVHDEAQMPFGGVKASGWGRFGGKAGINEFTDLRWITLETQPGHFPI
jgi:acyl-CoA reductase-like NAD-dependent aldehyde dehydrogenase